MSVWEITNFHTNTAAMVGPSLEMQFDPDLSESFWAQFENKVPGQLLHWEARPELAVLAKEGRKKLPARADVSPFTATGLVINGKVRTVLGDFLARFGQLLEINVDANTEYYYNVTNVVSCIDREHSEFDGPYVEVPVFLEQLVPCAPSIFVEPSIHGRIFVNDAAKIELEERIVSNKISGMDFKPWD
ncbi:hypothetical protein PY254_03060 [Rhodanobacter sp. AS-Z3]|uniref:hypothetical protein n=1 Tax=Rhodanobacter sp. AS-Z3 TaxID=3031330 RepID=UPI002478D548|nr:hypothetical protein [Rhodanobacter sp. AS-Z3]WEN15670.1 hypothetical protein PY254_03060 [Rhodanobacter sp. AS-Z3]